MKTIKKLIALLLVCILVAAVTACSSNEQQKENAQEGEQFYSSTENSVYGKITKVMGNEIEIAVAELPDNDANTEKWNDADVMIPNDNDIPMIGGSEAEDNTGKLEYTGETKSFTVQTGVKVYNMGQEINLSSLKKGDIVSVSVDSKNSDKVVSINKEQ